MYQRILKTESNIYIYFIIIADSVNKRFFTFFDCCNCVCQSSVDKVGYELCSLSLA